MCIRDRNNTGAGVNVLVEWVSANPTGDLHCGHARNAAWGDCISVSYTHLDVYKRQDVVWVSHFRYNIIDICEHNLMVECNLPKVDVRVRFPLLALKMKMLEKRIALIYIL